MQLAIVHLRKTIDSQSKFICSGCFIACYLVNYMSIKYISLKIILQQRLTYVCIKIAK